MTGCRVQVIAGLLTFVLGAITPAQAQTHPAPPRIEFFYTEGCETCYRVEHEILPLLEAQYTGQYALVRRDLDRDAAYLRLAGYQERLTIDPHATTVLIVNGRYIFDDWPSIRDDFLSTVGRLVAAPPALATATAPPPSDPSVSLDQLERRARGFAFIGVALAGLIDGINPCAIATLVFFISMLSVMKVRGARLLWAGAAFCLTSFITYLAIGLGLFRLLYLCAGFPVMRALLEWGMVAILLLLGLLSIRDAIRYRARGRATDITLKLPRRVSEAIHGAIRNGLTHHRILWGSVVAAFLVTVFESMCTGQVYVPTLVLVLRSGRSVPLVLGYLLLYNSLFILPLVLALILAYHGTRTERFVRWSRENVVPSKLALAALFFALAVLIAIV